jgi:hypothetical protein
MVILNCYQSRVFVLRILEHKTIILPVVLYGYKIQCLMLGPQHSLRVLRTIFGHEQEEITHPAWAWGPPSRLYYGCWFSLPEVKHPGHDVDHPLPPSTEDKERIELYLYPHLAPLGLLQGELYLYLFRRRI